MGKEQTVQASGHVVVVPDIGGAVDVDVIEVLVAVGEVVAVEQPLVTLEGDKATMEIPSPVAGTVTDLGLKVGDKVKQGDAILTLALSASDAGATAAKDTAITASIAQQGEKVAERPAEVSTVVQAVTQGSEVRPQPTPPSQTSSSSVGPYAGPAARRLARELDLDLHDIVGTGQKGRIQKQDVQHYVKSRMQSGSAAMAGAVGVPPLPDIDFSQFGPVETQQLNKIKRLTGQSLHRSWVRVPHVTQFDQADITELEAFRQSHKPQAVKQGFNLTLLPFVMKAVVATLQAFPTFNASLHSDGQSLIVKKYQHIGVAVDTPNGLVVPVLRDVDKKGVWDLAKELAAISKKAREKGLSMKEMQGSCFTISSLGGIGGTAFTPIVNLPDVAILGLSKARYQPVYHKEVRPTTPLQDKQQGEADFVPRLMLPLSLSYDHRVIDGAEGARFMVHLAACLADIRRLIM